MISMPFVIAGLIGLGGPEVAALLVLTMAVFAIRAVTRQRRTVYNRYCPHCGKGLTQQMDAPFCSYCGQRLP